MRKDSSFLWKLLQVHGVFDMETNMHAKYPRASTSAPLTEAGASMCTCMAIPASLALLVPCMKGGNTSWMVDTHVESLDARVVLFLRSGKESGSLSSSARTSSNCRRRHQLTMRHLIVPGMVSMG